MVAVLRGFGLAFGLRVGFATGLVLGVNWVFDFVGGGFAVDGFAGDQIVWVGVGQVCTFRRFC